MSMTHRLGAKRTPTTRAVGGGARVGVRGRLNVRGALLGDEQDKELWREARGEGGEDEKSVSGDESLWGRVSKGSAPGATKPFNGKQPQGKEEDLFADLEETLFKVDRDALQIQKADFTVNSVIDKINRGKVNLRPSYQREYVWTVRTASKLIESLILNIPIPTMFFHETQSGKLEVVDGKQRLTSIWSFIQGEFPDGSPFKLTGLEVYEDLNGKTFTDLHERFQETILDYPLNVHTISRSSQPDFVFEVFERLNMGATQLNEQELRNCIYQGR